MTLLGIEIDDRKLANAHRSMTVWFAGVFGLIGAFVNLHPQYLYDLGNVLMPNHVDLAHDILSFLIPMIGAGGVTLGRTRKSPPLEGRGEDAL